MDIEENMFDLRLFLWLALFIEFITIFGRFVLGLRGKEIYMRIMERLGFKRLFHFHHMFFGVILIIISYFVYPLFLFNLGLACIVSDAFHHFVVLKIFTGKSEFYIFH